VPSRPHQVYVVTPPGVEAVTARELRAIGCKVPVVAHGGLPVRMTTAELYAANLHLRTASRLLLRVARFPAPDFAALARGISAIPFETWLVDGEPASVRVDSVASMLHHTGAIEERVRDLLNVRGGSTVRVRVDHDVCTVSIDTSGEHLHRRGWRLETAKAPIRETLAAALLLVAGYDGSQPFLDPMCGSGTLAIEAASIAAGRAPGRDREFAFHTWPSFDEAVWARVHGAALANEHEPTVAVWAADRDAGAVAAARANAERAGVAMEVTTKSIGALAVPPGDPGLVAFNPPYGERIRGGTDQRDLFDALNRVLSERAAGWRVAVVSPDRSLVNRLPGPPVQETMTSNGGIAVGLYASPKSESQRTASQ
jgi:putative N6-adenine-specific DNA methylase